MTARRWRRCSGNTPSYKRYVSLHPGRDGCSSRLLHTRCCGCSAFEIPLMSTATRHFASPARPFATTAFYASYWALRLAPLLSLGYITCSDRLSRVGLDRSAVTPVLFVALFFYVNREIWVGMYCNISFSSGSMDIMINASRMEGSWHFECSPTVQLLPPSVPGFRQLLALSTILRV